MSVAQTYEVRLPEYFQKQLREMLGRIEFCTGQTFTLTLIAHTPEVEPVVIGRKEDRPPVDPQYQRENMLVPPKRLNTNDFLFNS